MRIVIHVSKIRVVAMVYIMCLMKMAYFNVWQVFLVKGLYDYIEDGDL